MKYFSDPLYEIIHEIEKNNENIKCNYEYFKNILTNINENENSEKIVNNIYDIELKDTENDNLAIMYYNRNFDTENKTDDFSNIYEISQSAKSIIFDKNNMKTIASQGTNIIYNKDALDYLEDKDWNDVKISKCYEGTMLLVFNHNDEWYVSTRRCINSENSTWVQNLSYRNLFDETMEMYPNLSFEKFNKNYVYHFILVHHKNRNIINYKDEFNNENYKKLLLSAVKEKYTQNNINLRKAVSEMNLTLEDMDIIDELNYDSLKSLVIDISKIDENNKNIQSITSEGYVLKHMNNGCVVTLKLQTSLYEEFSSLKPNNNCSAQNYLEMYQKNNLTRFLTFTGNNLNIVTRINKSLKYLTEEILQIYYETKKNKNTDIYSKLTSKYKNVLYELHGIYIKRKTQNNSAYIKNKDVYNYLKNLEPNELRRIYFEHKLMSNVESENRIKILLDERELNLQCDLMFFGQFD